MPKAWIDFVSDWTPEKCRNELAAILSIGILRWVCLHGQRSLSFAHLTVIVSPPPGDDFS